MAGALEQKSVAPPSPLPAATTPPAPMTKINSAKGNEVDMATFGARPLRLQDMLKTAMAESADKVNVSLEAVRQAGSSDDDVVTKQASAGDSIDSEYALKLASAIEFIASDFRKEAQEPGSGPGALAVMESPDGKHNYGNQGEGHNTVPMHPGTEAGAGEKLETTMKNPAGFHQKQTTALTAGHKHASAIKALFKKVAGSDEEKKETEGMSEAKKGLEKAEKAHEEEKKEASPFEAMARHMKKVAEDALNPAHISAGAAVPPEANASGESGGNPAGGAPQGPTGLVGSNESATNFTRSSAYAPRKGELKAYFNEPALTGATDKTLAVAFDNTPKAGTKFASADVTAGTKVAAARAVLSKLAEEAESKTGKGEKGN